MNQKFERVIAFVDGYNLYHSLRREGLTNYKWLDLKSLVSKFINNRTQKLVGVYYFSAYFTYKQDDYHKHRKYVNALQSTGVKAVMGKFKHKFSNCGQCGSRIQSYEEKRTDVNIGAYLLREAFKDRLDVAMILSGDTDFMGALEIFSEEFPEKQLKMVFPPKAGKSKSHFKKFAHQSATISTDDIKRSLLPRSVTLPNGYVQEAIPGWTPGDS